MAMTDVHYDSFRCLNMARQTWLTLTMQEDGAYER